MFREGLKVYPLARTGNPPAMQFFNGSKVPYNTIHANNFEFYRELDHVIQKEPVDLIDPELRGLAAAIGIRKGKPFAPDERMTKILTDAVAVGNATTRAVSFRDREPRSTRGADGRASPAPATTAGSTPMESVAATSMRARSSSTAIP